MQVSTTPQQQNVQTMQCNNVQPQVQLNPGTTVTNPQAVNNCCQQPMAAPTPITASGVNIHIYNPAVCAPGAQGPNYNVNSPCYPPGYYTGTIGPDGKFPQQQNQNTTQQTGNNANNHINEPQGTNGQSTGPNQNGVNNQSGTNGQNTASNPNGVNGQNGTDGNNGASGVNSSNNQNKKTEKRDIVQLTDDYIRNLENFLMSQEKEVRLNAAKQVYDRLAEDNSRYDDAALNALINKMLQDPAQEIKLLALSALEDRIVSGNELTVKLLKDMQQSSANNGLDSIDASNALLNMSAKKVQKEFEVKDNPKSEQKQSENKKEVKK